MIEVSRAGLLEKLGRGAKAGSLLVVGEPGAGKTWLLNEFVTRRKAEGDAAVLIRAEDHVAQSLQDLLASIGAADFIGALRAFPGKDKYLVIDALDALRAEAAQRAFRDLMRLVQRELPDWNIIASMRTFDARESIEFRSMFPLSLGAIEGALAIPTRNLLVPVFSGSEIGQAVQQDPRLEEVVRGASLDTIQLLQNPFNIWLIVHLLDERVDVDWLSSAQSTVQLLERYWQHRIDARSDAASRKHLLLYLTRGMVAKNTLVLSLHDISRELAQAESSFRNLLSDEILKKSVTERVSFAHNILFDFAVARLLLDEDRLIPFLVEDPARSIFFRPSIGYFLTRLWFSDRDLFWESAANIFAKSSGLPPRARITPALAVVECANLRTDLAPLRAIQDQQGSESVAFILKALQAVDAMTSRKSILWLDLLDELSQHFDPLFINEYLALLRTAVEQLPLHRKTTLSIAIRFLQWLWERAGSSDSEEIAYGYSTFGAAQVIPIVAMLYPTSREEARPILRRVLDRLGQPRAAANEAYWLVNSMDDIIEDDPTFATEIFTRVYSYRESSEEKTQIGGPVFSMTSTRAQDFSMAYYILGIKYQLLLNRDWREAGRAAVRAIDAEVRTVEGDTIRKLGLYKIRPLIAGITTELRSDRSEIWDQSYKENTSLSLLARFLQFIAEGLQAQRLSNNDTLEIIRMFAQDNVYPVIWKRLLEFSRHNILVLSQLSPLLIVPEILSAPELTFAAGEALSIIFKEKLFDEESRLAIQSAVLQIPQSQIASVYKNANEMRDRLLGCIPETELNPEALAIIDDLKKSSQVPKNEPFFRVGSATYGAPEEGWWLRQQGVDTSREVNQELLALESPLKGFSSQFLNSTPSKEDASAIAGALSQGYERFRAQEGADQPVVTEVFATFAAAAESILKNEQLPKDDSLVQLSRRIVLDASQFSYPEIPKDADASFDRPMWGSLPSIEGAQGIMHYVWNYGLDPEITDALNALIVNSRPAVRYQVAAYLHSVYKWDRDLFWRVAESMRAAEKSTGVLVALASSVTHGVIARHERERVIRWEKALLKQKLPKQRSEDILEIIAYSLTHLAVYYGDRDADRTLAAFARNPKKYSAQLEHVVRVAAGYLVPDTSMEGDPLAIRERAIKTIKRNLSGCDTALRELLRDQSVRSPRRETQRAKAIKGLLHVIDDAVFQLYIALGINKQLKRDDREVPDESSQHELFMALRPIWDLLTEASSVERSRPLAAPTTHHLMEIFTALLDAAPGPILRFASRLLSGMRLGYEFDSMAIQEIVKLSDRVLADHKELLRTSENAANLGNILDVFVNAGWPQATRLVILLDKAIR